MSAQPETFTTREWRISDPPIGYDGLRLHTADVGTLGPTDVLIKVHAVSLQRRDTSVSKGLYPLPLRPSVVLGSDAAGEVINVGSEVVKWRSGDRVAANFNILHIHGELDKTTENGTLGAGVDGVLSTFKVLPSEVRVDIRGSIESLLRRQLKQALVRIPDFMSYEEASTLPCAAVTAYNALLGGPHPLKGGDTVLIEGTGGVSIFALQIALASGATPIVLSSSAEKIAAVRKLGAEHVINYREVPDWHHEVLILTGGEGVHHVVEVAGGKSLDKTLQCTRYGGTISGIGFRAGVSPSEPSSPAIFTSRGMILTGDLQKDSSPDLFLRIVLKGVNIRGILVGSRTQFEDMNKLMAARKIRPVIDRVFSFEELVDALRYMETQKHVGKIVVKVT